jgi:hypothetical protein
MPKVSAKKLDLAREMALDCLEDIETDIAIMRSRLKVAKTKKELYDAVKPKPGTTSPERDATDELDIVFNEGE